MDRIIDGVARFRRDVFPQQRAEYHRLVKEGQSPTALVISCSDSRVMPEVITQAAPGELFVTRNAGNVVPPYAEPFEGVTAAIEYAVVGLGVRHLVVCGHTDCGAMKALLKPGALDAMPAVKTWMGHCRCAIDTFHHVHGAQASGKDAAALLAMENVAAQIAHLRTHPCVAARVASGELTLHGWIFDIEKGCVLALDSETGVFSVIESLETLPVALPAARRMVGPASAFTAAAE